MRITVHNRGPEAARLRVLPTLWFRNTWSWGDDEPKPSLRAAGPGVIHASHHELGDYWLSCDGASGAALHREREQHRAPLGPAERLALRQGCVPRLRRLGPERGGESRPGRDQGRGPLRARRARRRQPDGPPAARGRAGRPTPFSGFEKTFESRIADADEFYQRITPPSLNEDERRVHRQALAGMLWSKQFYYFDLERWLREHKSHPLARVAPARRAEHRVVPHAQRRHHLDAGQVGVPVVRGVGPRLPHHHPGAGGLRLRQGAAAADAAQSLRAPQRADPRLRVELQRRQSARCTRGPRSISTRWSGRSAGPTCVSWNGRSRG